MQPYEILFTVFLTTTIILLLVAGVVITLFITGRQRVGLDVKMSQMQVDYQRELRSVQNEVQEQVLSNVGRELHDNIGQLLTVMHVQMEQKKMMQPETEAALNPLHEILTHVIKEVRYLGRSLNSELLEQTGLLKTLDLEVTRLQHIPSLNVTWIHDDTEPKLSRDQRLMIFRIFQEIVNNSLKHSEASNMRIVFSGKDGLSLSVEDDGIGFNSTEMLQSTAGSGLKNIMKRAVLANLSCDIVAEIGKGCIFTLKYVD